MCRQECTVTNVTSYIPSLEHSWKHALKGKMYTPLTYQFHIEEVSYTSVCKEYKEINYNTICSSKRLGKKPKCQLQKLVERMKG